MKTLWWFAGGTAIGAAAMAVTVAAAASLGPVSADELTSVSGAGTPTFAIRDSFTAGNGTLINARSLELDPTNALTGFSSANAPSWTAANAWRVQSNAARRSGGGGTLAAWVPFTAQDGYVRGVFTNFANSNQTQGFALCYDPGTDSGVSVVVRRISGPVRWYFELGTLTGGSFSPTSSVLLGQGNGARPLNTEVRLTISDGTATASLGGVDQFTLGVTPANCPGTAAAMVSYTNAAATRFDDFLAVKTG
ncbi:MAG: hypothetical protein H6525_01170 [Actinobacteria bacterium]|nr:hypothetical protein [Actinomycetota bacterium]